MSTPPTPWPHGMCHRADVASRSLTARLTGHALARAYLPHLSVSVGKTIAGGRAQLQSNRSGGGGRGAGTLVSSPRWVRIFRMTTGSSMVATTRMRPPHRRQASTSTANVWRKQVRPRPGAPRGSHARRAGGGGGVLHGHGGGRLSTRCRTGRPRLTRTSLDRHDGPGSMGAGPLQPAGSPRLARRSQRLRRAARDRRVGPGRGGGASPALSRWPCRPRRSPPRRGRSPTLARRSPRPASAGAARCRARVPPPGCGAGP
jgi:hypothetical protein